MNNLLKLDNNDFGYFVLKIIQERFPDAIIAGGYLRDIYHNLPYKDIDIFLSAKHNASETNIKEYLKSKLERNDIHSVQTGSISTSLLNINNKIINSFTLIIYNKLVNFVILDDGIKPIEYVENGFDVGICKIYTDGKKIRIFPDFINDSRNKTLTIVADGLSKSELNYVISNHLERLKRKFVGWQVIIPKQYEEFI